MKEVVENLRGSGHVRHYHFKQSSLILLTIIL